jgi:hypothetical protein
MMTYANGEVYIGAWVDDQRCEEGIMKYANGEWYDGGWLDDKLKEECTLEHTTTQVILYAVCSL